ncbi:unnamed protein product [Protopolystoma xenopodis]|uniref:Uncharacterized protein n=1 Tax=Protopolystoma xenopodis TaxID=117903 RepID=A0A448WPZ5_9PLAT|nr:unnamed protein product [Protopolystoma xenopodis]
MYVASFFTLINTPCSNLTVCPYSSHTRSIHNYTDLSQISSSIEDVLESNPSTLVIFIAHSLQTHIKQGPAAFGLGSSISDTWEMTRDKSVRWKTTEETMGLYPGRM